MRSYGDRCGVARALDLVGERWALLVVRELLLGPKRFTDLRAGLPKVGPDMLSQRLRELEQAIVVRRRTLPPPAGSRVYELTERGRELEPVVLALGRWGSRAPFPGAGARLGVDSFVLALKTLFEPGDGLEATVQLRVAGQPFRARVAGGRFEVERGEAERPDATIAGHPGPLAAWLWHDGPDDAVRIEGDRAVAARFLERFSLGDQRISLRSM
jgi:DNA-binding HxlR family transcriptional regulator